jgi:hypothetical protein
MSKIFTKQKYLNFDRRKTITFNFRIIDGHTIMNDIVYIDHMKIADVAILDMQMSKVPIISGYDDDDTMRKTSKADIVHHFNCFRIRK